MGGTFQEDSAAFSRVRRRWNHLAKELADVSAKRLIGRSVTRMINVMFEIVEKLIAGGVSFGDVAGEGTVKNLIQPIIHALVQRTEIGDGHVHHPLAGFLGVGAFENILTQNQVGQDDSRRKKVGALI